MIENILAGASLIFAAGNIVAIFIGVFFGIVFGAIPGLTGTLLIALSIPITYYFGPIISLSYLLGVYKGGIYGGSITAILVATPGTPASTATVLDGYALTKQGKAGKALSLALYASCFGDIFSLLCLIIIAPMLARVAILVGPMDFTFIVLFALTVIATFSGDTMLRGIISALIGFLLSTVGLDPITGSSRFIFNLHELSGGFGQIPMLMGLFALSEIVMQSKESISNAAGKIIDKAYRKFISFKELKGLFKVMLSSSAVGTIIGALPGIGAAAACFICYGRAQASSKHPEKFGHGSLEGLAAAESGNNATVGGALIPMLTLGIPGDAVTAVLLTAFLIQGLFPGPRLFSQHADIVYALFIALLIGNVFMFGIGFYFIRAMVNIVNISKAYIYPLIFVCCSLGAYAIYNEQFDILALLIFGLLGYLLRLNGFPLPPLLIAFILGPMLERSLRQGLVISGGSLLPFITRPISLIFILLTLLIVLNVMRKSYLEFKGRLKTRGEVNVNS